MRKTLVINSGSSSLKFKLFTMPNYDVDCEGIIERIGLDGALSVKFNGEKKEYNFDIPNHEVGIDRLLEVLEENNLIDNKQVITKVGHRVVQGGEVFKKSTLIDDSNIEAIYDLAKLAPLHNKPNADGIAIFQKLLPHAINVAVFDTEFHQSMPKESYLYPVPYAWYEEFGVRRYGMHGTSHKFISKRIADILGKKCEDLKIINCHLGNGASLCAIKDGESLQTSMGLTPLAGIMMGTRSGDIDPSIFEYMTNQADMSVQEITADLNNKSGMLGLSGISSDFRDIEDAINAGDERAKMAMSVYVSRLVETIGSYYARLGGCDVITFTGGIGENDNGVRKYVLEALSCFGIELDDEANNNRKLGERLITTATSKIPSYVVFTDEEFQIASEAELF